MVEHYSKTYSTGKNDIDEGGLGFFFVVFFGPPPPFTVKSIIKCIEMIQQEQDETSRSQIQSMHDFIFVSGSIFQKMLALNFGI